ncbi:MAG: hypothetical protein ACLPZF_06580 [Candidatus Acidiferrales bacterium]
MALLSYLPLKSYWRVLPFFFYTAQVMKQLAKAEGLVGYSLLARPFSKRFWTLSVWKSEDALRGFVRHPLHARIMTALAPHMDETKFVRWTVQGSQLPLQWNDALRRSDTTGTQPARGEVVRDDIQLVELFLSQYKDSEGNAYHLAETPDVEERSAPAIEAVAVDAHGHRLAVEHTLIQPFEGQKSDDLPFLKGFERLELDRSLRVPDRLIEVIPPAFAIPKGHNWDTVGQRVHDWFKAARLTFADGESQHTIPNLPFELKVVVQTMDIAGTEGVVSVSRLLPKDRPFIDVLRTALARKLPKLVANPADRHILLLEDASSAIGFRQVIEGIDASREKFPQLSDVDEIWVTKTVVWKTAGDVWFCHVWPGGVQERFRIRTPNH